MGGMSDQDLTAARFKSCIVEFLVDWDEAKPRDRAAEDGMPCGRQDCSRSWMAHQMQMLQILPPMLTAMGFEKEEGGKCQGSRGTVHCSSSLQIPTDVRCSRSRTLEF